MVSDLSAARETARGNPHFVESIQHYICQLMQQTRLAEVIMGLSGKTVVVCVNSCRLPALISFVLAVSGQSQMLNVLLSSRTTRSIIHTI